MRYLAIAIALGALAPTLTSAWAQQGPPTPEQRAARFEAADTNKDGKLDKAEWKASLPEMMKSRMDDAQIEQVWSGRIDADGDGSITRDQYLNLQMRPGG